MKTSDKVLLMILDGWGIGDGSKADAITQAKTPYINSLYKQYPHSKLMASGEDVGLPDGQMGNSEVGHLNIGAGRIVYQDLVRINKAIKEKTIDNNEVLVHAYKYALENKKKVHLLGLVSDGGVHSSMEHLMKLCDIAKDMNLDNLYIHAFTDGRDTDPRSGKGFLSQLENHLTKSAGKVASVCGRYYAMDRDKRWERIKLAYDMLLKGKGEQFISSADAIDASYKQDVTDEFIKPSIIVDAQNKPLATIEPDDVVICFNFRTDRLRQMTTALTQKDMPEFEMHTLPLHYLTMTVYDETFKNIKVIFDKTDLSQTLGEILAINGKKQIRIAETEKYAHVTFFFSGGQEKEFEGEKRILINSPKVATYDLQPEMSAYLVKDALLPELQKQEADFICLNFANADMVGHTGIYTAIINALEAVDKCVAEVVETAKANNYNVIIIADHGNSDYAVNPDGTPNTAHSTNPVPFILINSAYKNAENGRLCDVAPTILKLMNIPQPELMTGKVLIK